MTIRKPRWISLQHTTLRWSILRWSVVLCAALLISACLPEPPSPTPIPPTPTASVTPTITPTIIWFPATPTPTPAPTIRIAPTQDTSPVYGAEILTDAFTNKSQWQTSQTAAGNITYGNGELTLAVATSKGTLTSLRKSPQLSDFYLEMDVTPSLCRGGDSYGLLIRASSSENFYRVMISCNAQVRLERYRNAYTAPLVDWTGSGQLFPDGPGTSRLGVYAVGSELRIYINRVLQFVTRDPAFTSGNLGVFARSAGDTPLSVSFSNLAVYEVTASQARPLPSPIPPPSVTPRPTSTRLPTPTRTP